MGSLGEGVGLLLLSDMLPRRGLFLVAWSIDSRLNSFLSPSSSSLLPSLPFAEELSELSELELRCRIGLRAAGTTGAGLGGEGAVGGKGKAREESW